MTILPSYDQQSCILVSLFFVLALNSNVALFWVKSSLMKTLGRSSPVSLRVRRAPITKLFLVGSSHMRFKFDYIITACYEMPSNVPVQHSRLVVENVSFVSVTRMSEFVVLWRMTLEKESLSEGDMVILQTGARDMALACLHDTMGLYTGKLVKALCDIRQKSLRCGFKLLVLTTPPFPEANIELKAKGNRNNYALAAFNRKLKMLLAEQGVEVFSEFSLLLVQQDNNACGCHYMCRGIVNNTSYIYGEAGRIAMRILISKHLC